MATPQIQINGGVGPADNQYAVDLTAVLGLVVLVDSTPGGTPQQRLWQMESYPGPLLAAPVFSSTTAGTTDFTATVDGIYIISMLRKDAGVWTKAYAVIGIANADGLIFPSPGLNGSLLRALGTAAIRAGYAGSAEALTDKLLDAILRYMYAAAIVGVPASRILAAGAGLTGGGNLSADRTFNVVAADGSIVVNPDSIQVGVISEAQVTNLVADLAALTATIATKAAVTRQIISGAGLTGGGDLSADRTLAVVAADSTIVVNPDSIQVGTVPQAQVTNLVSDLAAKVPTTRTITAGAGLTDGGDLSADRTLNIAAADASITVNPDSIQVGVISDAQHGTRGGGTTHSNATTSTAGYMSAEDKAANPDPTTVTTTDATVTVIASVALADNTLYWFEARVIGRGTAGVERAYYVRTVRAHRQGGGGATIGTPGTTFTDETSATMNCTFAVSGNNLQVTVQGIAATTINWKCELRTRNVV